MFVKLRASREEMVSMKRITLLLLVAVFLTISVSSDLFASSPVAGGRTTSVSTMLSHYLMIFVRAFDNQAVKLSESQMRHLRAEMQMILLTAGLFREIVVSMCLSSILARITRH